MGKFRVISLVASSLLVSSLMAETQALSVNAGWNLVGTKLDNSKIEANANILNIWKFTDGKWSNNDNGDLTLQAGNGFWINAKDVGNVNVTGDSSTKTLTFTEAGWNLSSPIAGDLNVASIIQSKYSKLWRFKDNKWTDNTQVTTVKVGEGFWIKTGSSGLTLDDLMTSSVVSGSVNLTGLSGTTSARALRGDEVVNPLTGTVQVYDASDETYSEPLLTEGITINPLTGEYIVSEDDFKDTTRAKLSTGLIIRAVVTNPLTGENYDLSALKTEKSSVIVNPITTSIRTQIIDTIKTMFGEAFVKDMRESANILAAINTLADAVSKKVEQDVKDGKLTLRETDFKTTKKPEDFKKQGKEDEDYLKEQKTKDELLQTQLKNSSAGTDIAGFENKVSYEKKSNLDLENMDLDKSSGDVDIAIMEYDMISTFAKMNLAVHDGKGRLIVFLPVPPEEFNTLPGQEFSIDVKDVAGKTHIIGGDSAIRAIDLGKDLKNANGSEMWAYPLIDALLESPVVPYEVIKTLVKKDLNESSLEKFGQYLASFKNLDGEPLFKENPLKVLIDKKVKLSNYPEESVKNIIGQYMKPLLASNLLWMQDNLLFEAIETGRDGKFLEIFETKNSETVEKFVDKVKESNEFNHFLTDVGVPLIHGIPPFGKENVVSFEDGYEFSPQSTILPRTGIALMNMVMETAGLQKIEIERMKINEIVDGHLPENAKYLADKEIWWAVEGVNNAREATATVTSIEASNDMQQWLRDFILGVTTQLTGVENIKVEGRFAQVINDVRKYAVDFKKKVEDKEKGFFEQKFVTADKIDSTVTFQVVDLDQAPLSEVKEVTFIPHLENIKTGEIRAVEDRITTFKPLDTQARFKKVVTVLSNKVKVNEKGEQSANGEWRYLEDYNVKILFNDGSEKGLTIQLDHPIPLFPIEQNNLNYIFIDKYFDSAIDEGIGMADDFHYQVLANNDKVFYPKLNRELASYNNLNFKAMAGVKFGVIADNWQEQENIWNSPTIPKPKFEDLLDSFAINFENGISEGALIMLDIDETAPASLRQLVKKKQLLMTIDFIDIETNEVGVAIEPMPQDNVNAELIKNEVPVCWDETNQEEIKLMPREDGTYPWPGDPDYPKECLVGMQGDLTLTDCMGKEFPVDENTGKYILPNQENKLTIFKDYSLGCMAEDYFGDFQDKFSGKLDKPVPTCWDSVNQEEIELPLINGYYPFPGEEGFPEECMDKNMMNNQPQEGIMANNELDMSLFDKKCDIDGNGILDKDEKDQCRVDFDNMSNEDMKEYLDTLKSKCDTDGNGDIDADEEAVCKAELENMGDDEALGLYIDTLKGKCDTDGNGIIDDTEKVQCQNDLGDVIGDELHNNNMNSDMNKPMCSDKDGNQVEVPKNSDGVYAKPGDGVWESVCIQSNNMMDTAKDTMKDMML